MICFIILDCPIFHRNCQQTCCKVYPNLQNKIEFEQICMPQWWSITFALLRALNIFNGGHWQFWNWKITAIFHTHVVAKRESTCKLKSANSSEQLCKLRLPRIAPIQFRWRMCKGIKRYNVRKIIKSTSKQKFGQENNAVKADEAICLILDYFTIISIALLHNMQVMVHRPICGFNERPTPPPVEDNFVIGERSLVFHHWQ